MNGPASESPSSTRSKDQISTIRMESPGSESPRSIRENHKGSGNLRGGGLQKVYVSQKPVSQTPLRSDVVVHALSKLALPRRAGRAVILAFYAFSLTLNCDRTLSPRDSH
ncbi:hypothetical protein ANCCAN_25512 [Ancylostoma caninum]|uniref:Uncharacterized protein n=1 Tax=Ancylostoma caninum TaxID=29170 RepID=A0A368F9L2_ANCCA|nr:hypothetical protein ANCCAN_25512 [Ancylostoma caninum]